MRPLLIALVALLLVACQSTPPAPPPKPVTPPAPLPVPPPKPEPTPAPVPKPAPPPAPKPSGPEVTPLPPGKLPAPSPLEPPQPLPVAEPTVASLLDAATWADLPDWQKDDLTAAWPAFLIGCEKLVSVAEWAEVCREGQKIDGADAAAVRAFFESRFLPWSARNLDGTREGTVTGYYEPLITGSPERTSTARYPIYAQPEDLISVDLSAVYPDLANRRLRGRLVGNKLLPYYDRAGIDDPASGFKAEVLAWADDAVELFFLQIQGSGRIQFPDGNSMRIGYADQNGHPYRSIGKLLIERGALTLAQASMQGIKAWGQANPDKLQALLEANPSYVFFCKLPDGLIGPLGALGVPLLAERTIAVDLRYIPLGAPVFLATTEPYSTVPLNRLMLAQDTGGAIRGGVRADFFWGFGNDAGARAGKMKQTGRMWVLLPRTYPVPAAPKP